jgi:hypothetical protein
MGDAGLARVRERYSRARSVEHWRALLTAVAG